MLQHEAKCALSGSWLNTLNTALNLYEVCQLCSPGETDGETCSTLQGEMKYEPKDEIILISLLFLEDTSNTTSGKNRKIDQGLGILITFELLLNIVFFLDCTVLMILKLKKIYGPNNLPTTAQ